MLKQVGIKKKIEKAKTTKEEKKILRAQEKLKKEQSLVAECEGNNYKEWTNCKGAYTAENGLKFNGLFV